MLRYITTRWTSVRRLIIILAVLSTSFMLNPTGYCMGEAFYVPTKFEMNPCGGVCE